MDSQSILVVDDDSESLSLLTSVLTGEGYQVRSANSGKLALASVTAWVPQLILLDLRMPDMDGFEVCRRLKASEKNRNVPLIFLSAANDLDERVAGLALGAVDYIVKPFQREELLARVATHLELGLLRTSLEEQVSQRTRELRATVEQLRESEARFRNMADTAPVLIWVSGPDKDCTFFNKGWLTFTGRTMEQELGKGWADNVHPDDMDHCWDTYSSSFDGRSNFQMEYRLRRADGEYRWLVDKGVPRFGPGGVFAGYIGSCVDMTDIKLAHEEDLNRQKLETVGLLASGIAHDFNNLLGVVLANSEMALDELAEDSASETELKSIRDAALRGAEIVRQLMSYAGKEEETQELVDVSAVVEDMLELLKVSVPKRVKVETDLGRKLPPVRANPAQIRQIVMNLFYNASEAIGDGAGVIQVTAGQVNVAASGGIAAGDYVQLDVSDTGRGMTPEVQARVFDAFFTTKSGSGHGLGLAAVHGIVESLHGTIRVLSTPGEGTRFEISLPCEKHMAARSG
jgi:two-component system, cell cycle sensor histidine kinase and response regulator CckA